LLNNCQVILVGPMFGGNVGATARAIKNTGLGGLTVVSPTYADENEARKFCHGAEEIYEGREIHEHLVDALGGRRVVVGFTARQRHRRQYTRLRDFAEEWVSLNAEAEDAAPTALLFGRERDGLTNAELDLCSDLVWIPSHPDHMSYNLAQAVLLTGYELFMAQLGLDPDAPVAVPRRTRPVSPGKRVDGKDLEELLTHLRRAFLSIGYCYEHTVDPMVRSYAEVFARAKLYQREARMIRGLARQMEWAAKHIDSSEED
jgi:TrmH family RNA methyltransferase